MVTNTFGALPIPVNLSLFAIAAALVWAAAVRLTTYAKAIAERTGAEQAFVGILLLGAVVSLPEMATTVSAAALGEARLAVNTLLGGIAATMAILAVTDAVTGTEALSTDISHPVVLLQGVLVVLFLAVAALGIVVGDIGMAGVGLWTMALFGLYVVFIFLVKRYGAKETWIARDKRGDESSKREVSQRQEIDRRSTRRIVVLTVAAAGVILGAGFVLAVTGQVLAEQTGLGTSFVGMLLGGIATSLPEVPTTVAAVRLAQYEMAFADAFGTNLFSVMLLFVADVAYAGGPILNEVDRFSLCAMLLGILLTAVSLAGLIERRYKSVLGIGIDSLIVLISYAGGLVLLFTMR